MRFAKCKWVEKRDPIWTGSDDDPYKLFTEYSIYPQTIFLDALEYAWRNWRVDEISDSDLENESGSLFDWIDGSNKLKPGSDFWRKCF